MKTDTRLTGIDLANPTYLLVSGKDELRSVVPLEIGASVIVGAGSNCKVQLQDESVQPLHCMFSMEDNNVLKVQDWNTGATYLNGELVAEETVMQSGDMVGIGSWCVTAVLDAKFHQRIAGELLSVNGGRESAADEAKESSLPTPAELGSIEQSQTNKFGQADDATGFSHGDELAAVADSKTDPASEPEFKYDIDADLKEDTAASSHAFDALPADIGFAFGNGDATGDDDTSLLMMEIEQLRFELADRDSQLLTLQNEREAVSNLSKVDDSDTVKLVSRLEDLLDELQSSDHRIQSLEELLRLSDEATAAERDERAQVEKWIREIENRIGQREAESQALVERLVKQLQVAQEDSAVLQTQLHSASVAGVSGDKQVEAVAALNKKVAQLRMKLQQANEKNRELLERPIQTDDEADLRTQLRKTQDELAELHLKVSHERADTARRHAELERMRAKLEQNVAQSSGDDSSGDARIRAMREHLREIHEQEQATKAEQGASGLSGRISNLLSRLR